MVNLYPAANLVFRWDSLDFCHD